MEQSKQYLNELKDVQIKDEEKALESKAEACLKLGLLEFQNGNLQSSVNYFEKEFFEKAKQLKVRQMIDTGRINTGIAKGLNGLELFKNIVKNDFMTFLTWKIKRSNNTSVAAPQPKPVPK